MYLWTSLNQPRKIDLEGAKAPAKMQHIFFHVANDTVQRVCCEIQVLQIWNSDVVFQGGIFFRALSLLNNYVVIYSMALKEIILFYYFFFTLFYFTILYWFCHTLTWIHHGFLPGESQGWGSLVGCRLRGRTESDTTEAT